MRTELKRLKFAALIFTSNPAAQINSSIKDCLNYNNKKVQKISCLWLILNLLPKRLCSASRKEQKVFCFLRWFSSIDQESRDALFQVYTLSFYSSFIYFVSAAATILKWFFPTSAGTSTLTAYFWKHLMEMKLLYLSFKKPNTEDEE